MPRSSLYLFLCAFFISSASWGAADSDFADGIDASKAGDYHAALQNFTDAQSASMDSAVLTFNIGVAHYKLGNYRQSKTFFARITNDSKWGALAEYNLGLLSEKMGQEQLARTHYRRAAERATTTKLRQLANAKVTTQPTRNIRADDAWIAYSSLAAGVDDNVLLADDALLGTVSDEEDSFIDVLGAASQFIKGDYADGWRLDLTGYYRGYSDLDDFDFGMVSAGLTYNRLLGDWHVQTGVKADTQFTGGDGFTSGGTFRVRAYHKFGDLGLRLTNDFGVIEGSNDYDYLSGTQNRTSVELIRKLDRTRLRLGYRYDMNDRDDLTLADEFFSYSPTRHRVFAAVEQTFSDKVSAEVRVSFRNSEYDDQNTEIEPDNTVTQTTRDEDRFGANIRVGYRITNRWRLFGEYQYIDNDANIDRYNYDSSIYMVGIELAP